MWEFCPKSSVNFSGFLVNGPKTKSEPIFAKSSIFWINPPIVSNIFIPSGTFKIKTPSKNWSKNALVIVCDSGAEKLISDERYSMGKFLIKIDHHIPQGEYGDLAYVDTTSESCCGVIARLIKETPLVMNKDAAQHLFSGMVTDSGRFRYSQTNSNTFLMAAYLMEFGVDTEYIYNKIYVEKLENVKLRAKLVSKFKTTKNGLAYLINTNSDVKKYGLSIFDISRGMVNIMSGIEGINVWANFTETDSGEVYCEFRSNGANVNQVATLFSGGGHLQASGCTLASISEVKEVIKELDKVAREYNG